MRLFIAVNFSKEIKKDLLKNIDELKSCSIKGNFTREGNLHLTLVFIGETHNLDIVKNAVDNIEFNKFKLKISGFGKFSRSGGDIYWVGISKNSELMNIYVQLVNNLKNTGFKIDERQYTPHITLGREVILDKTPEFSAKEPEMTVDKISLMKSERVNGKLTYTEIYSKHSADYLT